MKRLLMLPVLLAASCGQKGDMDAPQTVKLSCADFTEDIPEKFARIPPKLTWSNLPAGVREMALVVDDPDAPTAEPYVHFVLTRIPPAEGGPAPIVGKSESGKTEWEPLEPPRGETHRYRFRLYALDTPVAPSPLTKTELLAAIKGHVLAWGELKARYGRK
jgi:Raf kinase inhibitor-like YbhB/YbcL family protein